MLTILAGRAQDTNNPKYRESAAEYARFSPPSGLKLTVGMVADSVRGGMLGPEAAIAGAMKTLSESLETDIPLLLHSAFETAHRVVRRVGQENAIQLATTLTIALIVNNQQLYVANLGDSRAYLYRAKTGTFDQLTLEHTFANVAILEEKMSPRDAIAHPDANIMSRYLGTPTLIPPDMTIYSDSEVRNLGEGMARGAIGIELQPNDTVLLATNGLTKPSHQGGAVLTIDDIMAALSKEGARQSALAIVETAYRRHPTGTISVVVLQAIPEISARNRLTAGAIVGVVGATAALMLFAVLALFNAVNPPAPAAPTRNFETQTELAAVIIRSFTATPTPTNTPTATATLPPDANRLGLNFLNERDATDTPFNIERDRSVSAEDEFRVLAMNDITSDIERDAYVFVQPATDLRFTQVRNQRAYMLLDRNGDVFVAPRDYDLFEVELSQIRNIVFSGDEESCFAVYYSSTNAGREVTASCYAGTCTYRLPQDDTQNANTPTPIPQVIPVGSRIRVSLNTISVDNPPEPISLDEAQYYQNIYQRRVDINIGTCIEDFLPTPTPTGSPTAIILPTDTPTGTQRPTSVPNNIGLPTAVPVTPSETPRPTSVRYP
jgi:serine/threonine protein phosphatase PrpC